MYSLNVIKYTNEKAIADAKERKRLEDNFNRECSYHLLKNGDVILHSALRRSTGYLNKRRAKAFLASWYGTNSTEARNTLVESYFN